MKRWLLALLFSLVATVAAAQGCGPTNPNCIVPTRPANDNSNAAASTAYVDRAVGTIPAGVFTQNVTSYTNGATPLQTTDCGKARIVLTGGFYTFTVQNVINYPYPCATTIYNGDIINGSWNAKLISIAGFPTCKLWPGKTIVLTNNNGSAWLTSNNAGQSCTDTRWKISSAALQLYSDPAGSDANDCLQPSTPCLTISQNMSNIQKEFDTRGGNPTINLAPGTYNESGFQGVICLGSGAGTTEVTITGKIGLKANYIIAPVSGTYTVQARDGCILAVNGVSLHPMAQGVAMAVDQNGTMDVNDVEMLGCGTFCIGIQIGWNGAMNMTQAGSSSQVSISAANPAVVTWPGSAFANNQPVVFGPGSGTLPGAVTAGTTYYACNVSGTTFNLQTSSTCAGSNLNGAGAACAANCAGYLSSLVVDAGTGWGTVLQHNQGGHLGISNVPIVIPAALTMTSPGQFIQNFGGQLNLTGPGGVQAPTVVLGAGAGSASSGQQCTVDAFGVLQTNGITNFPGSANTCLPALTSSIGVSISSANPAVVTFPLALPAPNTPISFAAGSGTLPTAIVAGTTYYVAAINPSGGGPTTFTVSAAPGGTGLNGAGAVCSANCTGVLHIPRGVVQ
jgi:hypothetical protein